MSKFKIGDKVKILKKNVSYSDLWIEGMDYTQETEGVIISFNPQLDDFGPAYDIQVYDEKTWWYEEKWLEKVEENSVEQPTTWNNIEVGDVIKHTVSGATYPVVRLGDDRVFVADNNYYVLHEDIATIYKKSWEKPKALEDMSKAELIEIIKELKGEV